MITSETLLNKSNQWACITCEKMCRTSPEKHMSTSAHIAGIVCGKKNHYAKSHLCKWFTDCKNTSVTTRYDTIREEGNLYVFHFG